MSSPQLQYRTRAWLLAHKLLTLGRMVKDTYSKDLLHVPTSEITKAMGVSGSARLEDVQAFIYHVLEFMKGYGMVTACGCGYLSIRVGLKTTWNSAQERPTELNEFTVDDLEALMEKVLLDTQLASNPNECKFGDTT